VITFSLVDRDRRFGGICCREHYPKNETAGSSEALALINNKIPHCMPEDTDLQEVTRCRLTETVRENVKRIAAVLDGVDNGILRLQLENFCTLSTHCRHEGTKAPETASEEGNRSSFRNVIFFHNTAKAG
jgi:hypothetical protein